MSFVLLIKSAVSTQLSKGRAKNDATVQWTDKELVTGGGPVLQMAQSLMKPTWIDVFQIAFCVSTVHVVRSLRHCFAHA